MSKVNYFFAGAISVKSILEQGRRQAIRLYVDRSRRSKDFSYIISLAKRNEVPITFTDKEHLKELYPQGCGGILLEAEVREIPSFKTVRSFQGLAAYVDGVEDPYNMGSIVRSLYAAGCSLLVLPLRNWDYSEPTLLKASAGAWEKMDVVMIEDESRLPAWKDALGLSMVCAERKNAVSLFDYTFQPNTLMVIGGSRRGISAVVLAGSDANVYIPYGRDFKNALDAPSASAVFAFSYTRQFATQQK